MGLDEAKFFAYTDLPHTMTVGQECAALLLDSGECSIVGVDDQGDLIELGRWGGIRNLKTKGVNTCLALAGAQENSFHFLTHASGINTLTILLDWLRIQYKTRLQGQMDLHLCTPSKDLWESSIQGIEMDSDFRVQRHFPDYMEVALRVSPPDSLFQVICVGKDYLFFDD